MIPPEEMPFANPIKQAAKPVKVKIEFADETGAKYSINIEGSSKENIAKLIDFANSVSAKQPQQAADQPQEPMDTNFGKVFTLIQDRFRFGSFTSSDVLEAYQDEFKLPSSLSIISTYLARLAARSLLTRSRHGAGWIYKLPRPQQQPAQEIPNGISP
jgi:hypothetical protein